MSSLNKSYFSGTLQTIRYHLGAISLIAALGLGSGPLAAEEAVLQSRILAVGVPGASAASTIGYFHPGGPIRDKPEFSAYTQPGHILDPNRVIVTSSSNFGASKAVSGASEGAALSLDVSGTEVLVIPADFAAEGGQAAALGGKIMLFTAKSSGFANAVNTPGALTAALPPVDNPLGISINNGFGRLWFANAPGPAEIGTESIVDPTGQPLAGAPSQTAGGVFAGDKTNRRPSQIVDGGLRAGAVANALLGMSPDGSKRAVFAVLTADGAIIQAHTEQMVDGLVPPGTVTPLPVPPASDAQQALITRAGMLFNWVPDPILYVSDPVRNVIVAVRLADDGKVFRPQSIRRLEIPGLDAPVDMAPAVAERANPGFASNTTLGGGSDIYVVNRGNGTIMRITQAGQVLAIRHVAVAGQVLGPRRLNGIAVSQDGRRVYLTISGELPGYLGHQGALIEVPAFGVRSTALIPSPDGDQVPTLAKIGGQLFSTALTPAQGLGPLYNGVSCGECHSFPSVGGAAPTGLAIVYRVGRFDDGGHYDPLLADGGPVARKHAIASADPHCQRTSGIPAAANLISVRNAPSLFGAGLINAIPDDVILTQAEIQAARAGDIHGRANLIRTEDGQIHPGRFGWKADKPTLEAFVGEAMRNELGITNPQAPRDLMEALPDCPMTSQMKDDGTILRALTAFIAALPAPRPAADITDETGAALFVSTGCATCHTPRLKSSVGEVPLYSDLLLHDMGTVMDDGVVQGDARGRDWRTTPLWGLDMRLRYLHDGRASTVVSAVNAHGGEASHSLGAFRRLSSAERDHLLAFLATL